MISEAKFTNLFLYVNVSLANSLMSASMSSSSNFFMSSSGTGISISSMLLELSHGKSNGPNSLTRHSSSSCLVMLGSRSMVTRKAKQWQV